MLFNSIPFAIFFGILFVLYWGVRRWPRAQNLLLLAASYVFYGWWDMRFLVLITVTTAIAYSGGLTIQKGGMSHVQQMRVSLFVVLSALFFIAWYAVFNPSKQAPAPAPAAPAQAAAAENAPASDLEQVVELGDRPRPGGVVPLHRLNRLQQPVRLAEQPEPRQAVHQPPEHLLKAPRSDDPPGAAAAVQGDVQEGLPGK